MTGVVAAWPASPAAAGDAYRPFAPPRSAEASLQAVRRWLLAGATWLAAAAAAAQVAPGTTGAPGAAGAAAGEASGGRSPAQWLSAIQQAAHRQTYQGVVVYQRGSAVRSSRVAHQFEGGQSHERVLVLDGRRREYIRHGDETHCLYPDTRRVIIERSGRGGGGFPGLSAAAPAEILAQYRLGVGEIDRVAGREARVMGLDPVDPMRFGYRLWVDLATGLLLKVQTIGTEREVIEQVAFTELKVGGALDPGQLKPSWSTEGWKVERVEAHPADATAEGWRMTAPPGFVRRQDVRRALPGTPTPTLQAVFSDGLAAVSVFIVDPADPATPADETPVVQGPVSMVARRVGSATVTVIGEVPPATVLSIARSVEQVRR